ncbi:MAG: hypothetical protein LBF58_10850 [Deltaproteobacteria bacterium]|jgi:Rod binding domain-containing protein|nr:hypothetical protein [Deltaproteobacteria bacterium]
MSGAIYDIPGHSVPKEAFEAQKSVSYSANARAAGGRAAGRQPVAVFTVEEFKKGVNIGTGGSQGESAAGAEAKAEGQAGISLRDPSSGKLAEMMADLPEGAYGRRYRPLDNGKLADASQRLNGLSEEEKIGKLKQIKESAEEYEGFLIAEMIKNMRQSPFVKTAGSDTYSEIAEKPFTAALTKAGGLGLSQTIVTQVAAQEGLGDVLASHPEVMGPNWRQRLAPSQMPKAAPKLGFKPQAGAGGGAGAGEAGQADGGVGATQEE